MIRIFVGCASGDDLESQAVLEYTLRKHATQPLEITWMSLSRDPASPFYSDGARGWQTQNWSTPFSGLRWAVPSLCGFEGRAIYLDSDMIVMDDIAKLWRQDFKPGNVVLAKEDAGHWRFCVSVWDCAAARTHLLPAEELRRVHGHQAMIARLNNSRSPQPFDGAWNVLDGENFAALTDPAIKIIHYSAEDAQPHLKHAVPRLAREGKRHWFDGRIRKHWRPDLIDLFDRLLKEAVEAGFAPSRYAPAVPFGPYNLKSHAGYSSHRFARP